MLIVIEVRWTDVMWSLVSGYGVDDFFFPAPKVFDGNSNATAKSAASAGRNFMPPFDRQQIRSTSKICPAMPGKKGLVISYPLLGREIPITSND